MLKNYANEHPRNKKNNQDGNIKVVKRIISKNEFSNFLKPLYKDYVNDMKVQGKAPISINKYINERWDASKGKVIDYRKK